MYRIRFHGRGGQGMKTAANIVGAALFDSGFEVQDAPRYGAERRGAPMFAYVRAARGPIVERGGIVAPDLTVVADASLLGMAAAGVMQGAGTGTVMFVNSVEPAGDIQVRLRYPGRILAWPADRPVPELDAAAGVSAACAGAAARLIGAISRDVLERALVAETASRGAATAEVNRSFGLAGYDALTDYAGIVTEDSAKASLDDASPEWVELDVADPRAAVPDIFAEASSEIAKTGLWRSYRPVIDYAHCNRCAWVCSTLCPDSAIRVDPDRTPHIDYDHCKGCMVCVVACPPHAILQAPEHEARSREGKR